MLMWNGRIRVVIRRRGHWTVEEFDNNITNVGLNLLRDGLLFGYTSQVLYVALGDDATAPADGDTALGNELFRKPVTRSTAISTGQGTVTCFIAPPEATSFTTREIGWFGGPSASATAGSGALIARVLYTRAKSNMESIQIDRTDTITAA